MAAEILWDNEGAANADGMIVARIRQDGRRDEIYQGKTLMEVTNRVLEGKAAADERIRKQSKKLRELEPAPAPNEPKPVKPMDAGERMELATKGTDPAHFHEPVERVVETALGMPLTEVRRRLQMQTDTEEDARYQAEGAQFMRDNPDYHPIPVNNNALVNWLKLEGLNPTAENLSLAFSTLKAENAVVPKPTQEQTPPEREQRGSSSSGMRPSEAGGRPAQRTPQAEKYTAEQLLKMPQAEMARRLQDKSFAAMVDRVLAKPAR